uniref:Uncharacterized protein n=1 Tax=Romanomermis culicivorax TaxID=13658 RepID=A0A915KKM1_ROMCU
MASLIMDGKIKTSVFLSNFRWVILSGTVILHRAVPHGAGCSIHTKKRRGPAPHGTEFEV